MKNIKNLRSKLISLAIIALGAALMYLFEIPCIWKTLLSVPCPGCGMTRAVLCALRLDFSGAFHYHPMFWSLPLIALYLLFDGNIFGKKYLEYGIAGLFLLGFLAVWLLRIFGVIPVV